MPNQPQLNDRDRAVGNAVVPIAQITCLVDLLSVVIQYETNRHDNSEVAARLNEARDVLVKAYELAEARFNQL